MNLKPLFSPVVSFLKFAALQLSRADNKEGISIEDLNSIMNWVKSVEKDRHKSEPAGASPQPLTSQEKADKVAAWVQSKYNTKIPDWGWIPQAITWIAWLIQKRTGGVK